MAALYNLADAYVTPYHAEAFNMPALEAAACGVPLIVPRGGPTDDFVYAPSTVFIPTMVEELHEHNQVGSRGGWHYFQNMVSQYSFTEYTVTTIRAWSRSTATWRLPCAAPSCTKTR